MKAFAEDLCAYVGRRIADQDGAYIKGALRIVDARNHIFMDVPHQSTDEASDVYALADLCHLNEEMQTEPDMYRALAVARNYFA